MGSKPKKRKKDTLHKRAALDSAPSTRTSIPTVSFAVASSVIENAQTIELATCLSGQIARTAAIFNIDEIVVLDDSSSEEGSLGSGAAFLARILQYQETPQYLRRALIPMHKDLKLAGLLAPLDAPHHMRASEWCQYREGLVTESRADCGSIVDVGLEKAACIDQAVKVGVRVTLHMGDKPALRQFLLSQEQLYSAALASPSDPKEKAGLYWGYQVRIATSVKALLTGSPYQEGYDLKIGTSEHGSVSSASDLVLPPFQHLLIVFGGPLGLEEYFSRDDTVSSEDPRKCFDIYINTCPRQGSRTIRTEEALLISLSYLQPALSIDRAADEPQEQ